MNEENKSNYFAVIPATVRYDQRLTPAEKLLYGEITALANKEGYCYAQNRYFANLYNVAIGSVSRWLSHLQKFGYIIIEIIRNNKKEVVERHIYIVDNPYSQKCEHTTNIDVNKNIDDELLNKITNNSSEISEEFYEVLDSLELLYPQRLILNMQQENLQKINVIVNVLYELYNSNLNYMLKKMDRRTLSKLYSISEMNNPDNLKSYFKKSVINNYF